MKALKRLIAVIAVLALTVGLSANCMAATWGSYFGLNSGWYEGAEGELTAQTEDGWTANLVQLGWGGCWGGQVFQKEGSVDIKKGEEYQIKYTISSSNCDKWVYLKIAKGEDLAFAKWVQVKKGGSVTVDETFTAKANADSVYFGIGGEFGDRQESDKDAELRYSYAPGGADALDDVDPTLATKLTCKGFYLGAPETGASDKPAENKEDGTVSTGDFMPIACGTAAVVAAAVVVIFARKRETE